MPPILVMSAILFATVIAMYVISGILDLWDDFRSRKARRALGIDGSSGGALNLEAELEGPKGQKHTPGGPHRGIAPPRPRLRADRLNRPGGLEKPHIG